MRYSVKVTKKAMKGIALVPKRVQEAFHALSCDLEEFGPVQTKWMNYSKLNGNSHHCHLAHKWVACWSFEDGTIQVEVYYVGSRENAPY